MYVELSTVSEWTCLAPTASGGKCGCEHRLRAQAAWHLWQCQECGAPRWDGPGWQLEQRLAAALQAGAALGDALLPPYGAGTSGAAAVAAASAALARLRWEAAGAAGDAAVPPDAAAAAGQDSGSEGGSKGEAAAPPHGLLAAGLPSLAGETAFEELTELAASMLADSRE